MGKANFLDADRPYFGVLDSGANASHVSSRGIGAPYFPWSSRNVINTSIGHSHSVPWNYHRMDNSVGSFQLKMEPSSEALETHSEKLFDSAQNSRSNSPTGSQSDGQGNSKQGRQDSKICGVCGDKALGNNFNAITCESCKAFFRRNALKTKEFVCPFSDNCKVDAVTRRFCQKCRLKKCFDIGMKKEWIMTDEEKKMKKIKIEQNRMKRQSSDYSPCDTPAPKVACMVAPKMSSELDSMTDSQDSPPDPTLPHKMSQDEAMMPHADHHHHHDESQFREDFTPLSGLPVINALENVPQNQMDRNDDGPSAWAKFEDAKQACPSALETPLLNSLIRPSIAESPSEPTTIDSEATASVIGQGLGSQTVEQGSGQVPTSLAPAHPSDFSHFADSLEDESRSQMNSFCDSWSSTLPLPLNTMDSIVSVAIKAEFSAFGALNCRGIASSSSQSKLLNKAEQNKLDELLLASQELQAPVDTEGPVKVFDQSLINVINMTDIAIRRLIKMSKKISAFKSMCQEDQIALLKGGCTEMMILRSVVSYDPDRDSWNIPHSEGDVGYNINLGVLKEARGNLYEEHQRFLKSFKTGWRSDENIMMLLCSVTLFTPERPNVIHKDVVKLEQDSYLYLLKRYLESVMDGCEARSTYLQLIKIVAELRVLNATQLKVFLALNPREVAPLLIEIFDLK